MSSLSLVLFLLPPFFLPAPEVVLLEHVLMLVPFQRDATGASIHFLSGVFNMVLMTFNVTCVTPLKHTAIAGFPSPVSVIFITCFSCECFLPKARRSRCGAKV